MTVEPILFDGALAQYREAPFVDAPMAAAELRLAWQGRGAVWAGAWTSSAWPTMRFGALVAGSTRGVILTQVGDEAICDVLTWLADGTLLYTTSLEYPLDLKKHGVVHQPLGQLEIDALLALHDGRLERLETLCGDAQVLDGTVLGLLERLDPLYAMILKTAQDEERRKKPALPPH